MWARVPVHMERRRWAEYMHSATYVSWLQVHCAVPPCVVPPRVSAAMSSPLWQTVAQPPYNLPAWSSFGQVFSHGSRKVTDTAILLTTTKHPSLRSVFQQEAHTSISACSDVTAAVISSCFAQFELSNQILWTRSTDISFLVSLWAAIQGDIPAEFDSWWGLFSWGVKFQSFAVPLCVLSSGYIHKGTLLSSSFP